MRNWLVGGLVAGLAATGIVMIVQAAIPDPSGVIHACYRPNGNVRLVDKSSCTGNETAISWNQTGPAGPQGEAGPQGSAGTSGSAGSSRSSWAAGSCRPAGRARSSGLTWTTRTSGLPGPSGPAGVSGYEIINTHGNLPVNGTTSVVATCSSGKRVLGGGYVVPRSAIRRRCHDLRVTTHGASISRATVAAAMRRCMRSVRGQLGAAGCRPSRFVKHHNNITGQPIGNRSVFSP